MINAQIQQFEERRVAAAKKAAEMADMEAKAKMKLGILIFYSFMSLLSLKLVFFENTENGYKSWQKLNEMRRASVQQMEAAAKAGAANLKPYDIEEARKRSAARRRKAPRRGYVRTRDTNL